MASYKTDRPSPILDEICSEMIAYVAGQGVPCCSALTYAKGYLPERNEIAAATGRPASTICKLLSGYNGWDRHRVLHPVAEGRYVRTFRPQRHFHLTFWWLKGHDIPDGWEPPLMAPAVPPGYAHKHTRGALIMQAVERVEAVLRQEGGPVLARDIDDSVFDGLPRLVTHPFKIRTLERWDSPARARLHFWLHAGRRWVWYAGQEPPSWFFSGTRRRSARTSWERSAMPVPARRTSWRLLD